MAALPGAPEIAYRDGRLFIEALAADRAGAPFRHAALRLLERGDGARPRRLPARSGRPRAPVCYAVKANSSLAVLQWFARRGCGFDIVSGGELERVLAAGGDPQRIVFSGVGKTRAEMRRRLDADVMCFNVESVGELELLGRGRDGAGRRARVSLRVNPDVDPKTHPYISTGLRANKFGIAHDEAPPAFAAPRGCRGIEVVGIDCHIGSQIVETEPYVDALDRLLDLVERSRPKACARPHRRRRRPRHHLPDETPPRAGALVGAAARAHRRARPRPPQDRVRAGPLAGRQRRRAAQRGALPEARRRAKNFCIVDAAMNDLMRPAMYDAWMRIVECEPRDGGAATCDVVGPVCESGDWLGRDRALAVAAGDFIAVLSAGAYAMSMASNYNTRGRAPPR